MQLIDLRYPVNGIPYEIQHFPDGELQFVLKGELCHKEGVRVNARVANANELFILTQVLDICNRHGMIPEVHISYLMGARMDRVMDFNRPFSMKVVQDVLDRYDADFFVYDPHNPALICRSQKWRVDRMEKFVFAEDFVLCFADKGAKSRYSGDKCVCYVRDRFHCEKEREPTTGKLNGFKVELDGVEKDRIKGTKVVLIDDLCDGGGTFLGIIKLLRELNPKSISLCLSHAVQREGLVKVANEYDDVYVTDSYKDWSTENLPSNVHVKRLYQ